MSIYTKYKTTKPSKLQEQMTDKELNHFLKHYEKERMKVHLGYLAIQVLNHKIAQLKAVLKWR